VNILLICPQYTDIILPSMAADSLYRLSKSVARTRRPNANTVIPIGLSYVAATLETRHNVKLVYEDVTRADILAFAPDLVGISCVLSMQESITFEFAEFIRQILPHGKVVVGGTHPTALPERMLACDQIDFVILGEGEYSMLELASRLQSNESIDDIDGIAFRDNGTITVNPKTDLIENLDEIPIPSLSFGGSLSKCVSLAHKAWGKVALLNFAMEKYSGVEGQSERFKILKRRKNTIDISRKFYSSRSELAWIQQPMQCLVTSRGCPFDCSYCTSQMMWKKQYRIRSIANLVEEVQRFPRREILICDENMSLNRERTKQFFEAVRPLNKEFFFYNGIDPYTLDDELIRIMKDGGVTKLSISVESGSSDRARQIHRRLDLDKIKEVLTSLQKNRILTMLYFIVGFPGETKDDIRRTVDVMEDCMINFSVIVHIFKFLFLPGSRLFEEHCGNTYPDFEQYCFFPFENYDLFRINNSVAFIPPEVSALIDHGKYALTKEK
jgi:magnesium-protoporphyrin IX monomethyl ester (oxidative) cyclase